MTYREWIVARLVLAVPVTELTASCVGRRGRVQPCTNVRQLTVSLLKANVVAACISLTWE